MQVKVTRIYLSERSALLDKLFEHLHQHDVKGATVFRGVKGFGMSGQTRENHILDMHFDLPMVLEFYDEPSRVDDVLAAFEGTIESGRMIQWLAEVN